MFIKKKKKKNKVVNSWSTKKLTSHSHDSWTRKKSRNRPWGWERESRTNRVWVHKNKKDRKKVWSFRNAVQSSSRTKRASDYISTNTTPPIFLVITHDYWLILLSFFFFTVTKNPKHKKQLFLKREREKINKERSCNWNCII